MKKYIRTGIPVMLILICAALYVFVPGIKQIFQTAAVDGRYQSTDSADVFSLRQVITSDSSLSRTIMWQSKPQEKEAVVEYRIKGAKEIYTVKAVNEEFEDDSTAGYIHSAVAAPLAPGTSYEYRVGYDEKRSSWHPLSAADGKDFKALIFPDSQSSDYGVWHDTAQAAWKNNPDAQFFVNMGDLVDNGEDHNQWNAWFDAVGGMITAIPSAPVTGNHETYNREWKVRMPVAYLHMFSLPQAAPEKYQNQYYSFDYGDVHFVVLNTQLAEMEQFQTDMLADEADWFRKDMAETKKKWKVVMMHKDVLQYGFQTRPQPREEGFSDEGRDFMPLFDQYNVDVVLTAHLHTYRNRGHIRNFVRDPSGPLYIITGVAGDVRYPELWKRHSLDEVVAPQPESDNYMTLNASENTLTFSAFLLDGKQIDTVSVNKL